VTEFAQLVLEALVPARRVVPGQPLDQRGDLLRQRWAAGAVRVGPLPGSPGRPSPAAAWGSPAAGRRPRAAARAVRRPSTRWSGLATTASRPAERRSGRAAAATRLTIIPQSQSGPSAQATGSLNRLFGPPHAAVVPQARLADPQVLRQLGEQLGPLTGQLHGTTSELFRVRRRHGHDPSRWPAATSGGVSVLRGEAQCVRGDVGERGVGQLASLGRGLSGSGGWLVGLVFPCC